MIARPTLLLVLAAAALLALPLGASAQANDAPPIDFVLTLRPGAEPRYEGPEGLLALAAAEPGERYEWRVQTQKEYTTGEVRVEGAFDVARARQVVPTLVVDPTEAVCQDPRTRGTCDYPLFTWVPRPAIWDVDGPVRIVNLTGENGRYVIRIGIPGPVNATLALTRDVTPPSFELREPRDVTHYSFYQETTTDELALADLQVRPAGSAKEWVRNPTTVYHVLQRFPVQGLDADTEHEVRVRFEDWAGNVAESEVYRVRSAAEPVRPKPVVLPITPPPNGTIAEGLVAIEARIESPESPVALTGVRVFLDKREIHEGWSFDGTHVSYHPREPLPPGRHTVSVEAMNDAGGKSYAQWSFVVGREQTPAPGAALAFAVVALAAVALRRRG